MALMVNRLGDLRREGREESPPLDVMGEEEDGLEGFFASIEDMITTIDKLEGMLDEIAAVQSDIITKPATANKAYKERHSQLMEEVKRLSQSVHRGLKRLQQEIKRDELGPDRHSAEFRIKKSQFASISQRLKRIMLTYNKLEEEHREKCKGLIKRQLRTVDPSQNPSDDKVEELLETQDLSVFTQDILTATAQKRQALDEVESRKREILQLQENIEELHDMFYDMMLLVEEQGDMIDNIEHQVQHAAVYVQKGMESTSKAVTYKKRNRKMRWVICIVVTTVVVVIVIVIAIIIAIAVSLGSNSLN